MIKKIITNDYIYDGNDKDFLSDTDNRMEEVQTMLTQKYNKSNYYIYVKQLSSQTTASINANTIIYEIIANIIYIVKRLFVLESYNIYYVKRAKNYILKYRTHVLLLITQCFKTGNRI